MSTRAFAAITLAASLLATRGLFAYIERLYSLREVLDESTCVLAGRIEKIDRTRRLAIAAVDRALKGTLDFRQVRMNLGVGTRDQADYLLARWKEGAPFILFYDREGNNLSSCGHAGDTWFQLFATDEGDRNRVWWRFTHLEVYMGRTFDGASDELIQVTEGVLAGRIRPPPPDPSVPKLDIRRPREPSQRRRPPENAERAVLLARGADWKYLKGSAAAAVSRSEWRARDFDDGAWSSAKAPFGYGDGPFGTELRDMASGAGRSGYTTLYLRRSFEVSSPERVEALYLDIDYDDGCIVWLNERRVLARNEPQGEPRHDSVAAAQHESGSYERFEVGNPAKALVAGRNIVAVQVFNISSTSSDLKLDLEVSARVKAGQAGGGFRERFEHPRKSPEPRGISWADVNGDERLDAYFARAAGGNVLLVASGERSFEEAAERYGVASRSRSAAWADANGDDHPDLVTSSFELFLHAGAALRKDSSALPAPPRQNPEGAGWIDADGDGLVEVLITNGEHGILLYKRRSEGSLRFVDASARAGLGPGGIGQGNGDFIACADYDGDGTTDFFYNLGDGVLARNAGDGTFRLDTRAGIALPHPGADAKRGVSVADFDNDGDMDAFVPSPRKPRLYRNGNDGTFTDVLAESGDLSRVPSGSFSAAWADADCDGNLDLFVCVPGGTSRLYLGDGRGRFRDATAEAGLDRGLDRVWAASFADADGDLVPDLALSLERGAVIAFNDLERPTGRAPLAVTVKSRRGTTGAAVRLQDPSGRPLGLRHLGVAEGAGGQSPPVASFAAPLGASKVFVVLTDGRLAEKEVQVAAEGLAVTFRETDFD